VFCAVSAVITEGAVDAERGKRLQVRLDAGTARGIGAGDGQRDRRRHQSLVKMRGFRAMACPSAPCHWQQAGLPLGRPFWPIGPTFSETTTMVPFFVQFKCKLGQSYAVANALAEAEIASEIYSTAGDYDLLVKFYVDNDTDIGHFVNEKVQVIPGIQDTHTIITFKAFGTG
jgi:DNA-binding Lrp family transcriptional regulator